MRYAEYPPWPRFQPIVDRYWILEGVGSGAPEGVIPDGCVEIIFHYGDRFFRHRNDGLVERQPSSVIAGQITEPAVLSWNGRAGVLGVRLRPAAARALLRVPVDALTGQIVDLEGELGPTADLREQLAEAPDDRRRVDATESWLSPRCVGAPRAEVTAAVGALRAGRSDIERVADDIGLTRRQLERLFLKEAGLPPKTLARIFRLQRALGAIRRGEALADAAVACGYYDQAHMALDFRRLAEMSPSAWITYGGELAPLFAGLS